MSDQEAKGPLQYGRMRVAPTPTKVSYERYRSDEPLYIGPDGMITRTPPAPVSINKPAKD